MLQNIGLHATVWEEEETVLMVLTDLNISYWCDEVLLEQWLPVIPGKSTAAEFSLSRKGERSSQPQFLVSHAIKLQVESNAK